MEKGHYESFRSASQRADCSGLPPFALAKSGLKGVLVSRLKGTSLAIVNTHPLANDDWDWSPGNRFYSLEEAQLGEVVKVVKNLRENNLKVVLGADLMTLTDCVEHLASLLRHEGFEPLSAGVGLRQTKKNTQTCVFLTLLSKMAGHVAQNWNTI